MSSFIFEKVSVADDTEESIGEQFVGGLSVAKIMKRNNPDDNFKKFESFILPIGLQYNAVKEGVETLFQMKNIVLWMNPIF